MAYNVKTLQLAAYIEGRKATFAGAPVTLKRLAQMWSINLAQNVVAEDVLARIAQYFRMPIAEFAAAIQKMPLMQVSTLTPSTPPVAPAKTAPAPVLTVPTPASPPPAIAPSVPPTPPPAPPAPVAATPPAAPSAPLREPVGVMVAPEQLEDLVEATRTPEPPSEAVRDSEPEISIAFDEVENTPPPTAADPKPKSRRGKGNKKR